MKNQLRILFTLIIAFIYINVNAQWQGPGVTGAGNMYFTNGNVGIGTSSPDRQLHILGSGWDNQLLLQRANHNTGFSISADNNSVYFYKIAGIGIAEVKTPLMVFKQSSGYVGIGTTTPGYNFEVERSNALNNTEYLLGAFNHSGNAGGVYLGYVGDGADAKEARVRAGGSIDLAIGTTAYKQAMFVSNTNGNVGIGTATPATKLDIVGGALRVSHSGNQRLEITQNMNNDGTAIFDNRAAIGDMKFQMTGSDKLTIKRSGSVGIGTTSPDALLHVTANSISETSNSKYSANLIVQGTGTSRAVGEGSALGFVVPANTDGSNAWQQGRILVTPDNNVNSNASGRMYLQTRYYNGSWDWRNNLTLVSSGNVGIGTTAPLEKLHVNGTASIEGNIGSPTDNYYKTVNHTLELQNTDGGDVVLSMHRAGYSSANIKYTSAKDLVLSSSGVHTANHLTIKNDGNVGIGTTDTFGYKLAVNGTIGSKEVNVEASSAWPDYVFAKDYKLKSLSDTESFIKAEGHLPNIPSAQEVAENGIQLGDMNAKLLEKIEELTLHLINQQKEIETLKAEVKAMQ